MKKYLAYYENEWPTDITELTTVENKPFVGYLKANKEVKYTDIITGPADNEIWYKNTSGERSTFAFMTGDPGDEVITTFIPGEGDYKTVGGYNIVSHQFNPVTGYFVIKCDKSITSTFLNTVLVSYMGDQKFLADVEEMYLPKSISDIQANLLAPVVRYNGTKNEWLDISYHFVYMNDQFIEYGDLVSVVHCINGDITDLPKGDGVSLNS